MIKSSTQTLYADGSQKVTFRTEVPPATAEISWFIEIPPAEDQEEPTYERQERVVSLNYEADTDSYYFIETIPAREFFVKLNNVQRTVRFFSEWGDQLPQEYSDLEYREFGSVLYFKVPYCDLAQADLRFFTLTNTSLDSWNYDGRKKAWIVSGIYVEDLYGGATLVAEIGVDLNSVLTKARGADDWVSLSDRPGGFIVEVVGHTRVTSDRVVNATICRDSLYGKTWRRVVEYEASDS